MKMLPVQLSLNPLNPGLWSDVLWRCPPAPPSQLAELKTQLPPSLPSDPRLWGREDVTAFLRFCEREFDLPKVDYELFQMNGKALCLLTRADFGHRCPGAGDVLHNVLQMLIIESHMMQWHLPNSPVTPTSRYPLSPHSHPATPTWPPIAPPESPFHGATHMHHFMAPNSVTLSPPPSVDSQASSPPQSQEQNAAAAAAAVAGATGNCAAGSGGSSNSSSNSGSSTAAGGGGAPNSAYGSHGNNANTTSASTCSNQSDSDEESYAEAKHKNALAAAVAAQYSASPPHTPILKDMSQSITQKITNSFVSSWQNQSAHGQKLPSNGGGGGGGGGNGAGGSVSAPTTPSYMQSVKREFFPENSEPNTNGRLLWDFLQQLLNDRNQKYSDLIAWKCCDTGVFKIVDPAGLAKLWGIQKNHLSMNYDKMSRALRYYYRVNILRKVQGERHCYQFLRNPTELKNIKNISLLRQSVNSPNGGNGNAAASAIKQENNQNGASANWSLAHLQQATAAAQQHQPSPQSPSPRNSSNGGGSGSHLNLPAAAAAVAAAAAAAYGPPPSSPLFMHAFHYLSASNAAGPPPNSPALPSNASDKFQFHGLKLEQNGAEHSEEMKPTDLSVSGSAANGEKRPFSSPSANEDCYPLIRNADGLTTIKLIRYNDTDSSSAAKQGGAAAAADQHQGLHMATSPHHMAVALDASASPSSSSTSALGGSDEHTNSAHTPMESDSNSSEAPTDLRK